MKKCDISDFVLPVVGALAVGIVVGIVSTWDLHKSHVYVLEFDTKRDGRQVRVWLDGKLIRDRYEDTFSKSWRAQ